MVTHESSISRHLLVHVVLMLSTVTVSSVIVWQFLADDFSSNPLLVLSTVAGCTVFFGSWIGYVAVTAVSTMYGLKSLNTTCEMRLPGTQRFEVAAGKKGRRRVLVFFRNVSPDAVRGTIKVLTDEGATILLELKEPEPLALGGSDRKSAWWPRGTPRSKRVVRISAGASNEKTTIVLNLDWNFIGTRLEKIVPGDRILQCEILVRDL